MAFRAFAGLSCCSVAALSLGLCAASALAQTKPVPRRPPPSTPPKTGTVVTPSAPSTAPVLRVPLARLRGEVLDSITPGPLRGATVQFVAANDPSSVRSALTDSVGAFVMDSVRSGLYLVGMVHPRMDQLGLSARVTPVQISVDAADPLGELSLTLATPSPATLLAGACEGRSAAAFLGLVRSASGAPLPARARVRAQYTVTTVREGAVQRRSPSQFVDANDDGSFVLCGLPADATISARAYAGTDSSGVVELRVPRHGLLVRDLVVANPRRVTVGGGETVRETALYGSARARGVVRDSAGKPLAGARVSVVGANRDAATSSTGTLQFDSLPGGSWMLEARAVGYQPQRTAVDLRDGETVTVSLDLQALAPLVDTVKVRADAWSREQSEFERRKAMGGGYFLDGATIARRNPQFMSDLVRGVPGVTVVPGSMGGTDRVMMRGSSGAGSCIPAVFINGMQVPVPNGILENVVNPADVRAMEVYTRGASIPAQFQNRDGCGSMVIWTGRR